MKSKNTSLGMANFTMKDNMSERTEEEQKMDKKLFEGRSKELKKYGVEMSAEDISHLSFELWQEILKDAKEEFESKHPDAGTYVKPTGPTADDIYQGRIDTLTGEGFIRDFDVFTKGEKSVTTMQIRALSDKNFAALFEETPVAPELPPTDVVHDKQAFELFIQCLNGINLPAVKLDKSKELVKEVEGLRIRMIAFIEKYMP